MSGALPAILGLPVLPAPWHLGRLHGLEGFAVLLLLFGPLLVAVVTVFYIRWRDEQGDEVTDPDNRSTP